MRSCRVTHSRTSPPGKGSELREAVVLLLILTGRRDLTAVVKQEVARMPVTIDIDQNEFLQEIYQQGEQKGRTEGRSEGRAEGRSEGRAEGAREALLSTLLELVQARFGPVPEELQNRAASATIEELRAAIRRSASATDPAGLFV